MKQFSTNSTRIQFFFILMLAFSMNAFAQLDTELPTGYDTTDEVVVIYDDWIYDDIIIWNDPIIIIWDDPIIWDVPIIVIDLSDQDGDGYTSSDDCDDNDAGINPGAAEICGDGIDNNCDGQIDEGFDDTDSDGELDCVDTDDDGDGCLDADDDAPLTFDDGDTDGTGDCADNCPAVVNADQADTDGDGAGDVCDACPEDADHADADGNGFPDCIDCGNNKILICHVPPGNPCNEKETCVNENAAQAHLGDGNGHGGCYAGVCRLLYCPEGRNAKITEDVKQEAAVYPNPATNRFHVDLHDFMEASSQVSLVDYLGKVVWTREVVAGTHDITVGIQDNLMNGLYMVVVKQGNNVSTKKLMIVK